VPLTQPQDPAAQASLRPEVKIIIIMPGRYSLIDTQRAGGGLELGCRAVSLSPRALGLVAPVAGGLGDRVIASIDRLGTFKGSITRLLDRGFVMSISATQEERSQLAAKLEWVEKHKNHDVADARAHPRLVPQEQYSTIILPDGSTLPCFVIDMSAAGAAVSARAAPAVGTPVALGQVVGWVVRSLPGGFALQFVRAQDSALLQRRVIKP
jgi:hypothetical protein